VNFAVDLEFPHPSGNELGVLGAEVQNQDFFFMRIRHFEFRVVGATRWVAQFRVFEKDFIEATVAQASSLC
jgi:hypothetical protein